MLFFICAALGRALFDLFVDLYQIIPPTSYNTTHIEQL